MALAIFTQNSNLQPWDFTNCIPLLRGDRGLDPSLGDATGMLGFRVVSQRSGAIGEAAL